jgi:hypothetical protein
MRSRSMLVIWPVLASFLVGCNETVSKQETTPLANAAETVKNPTKRSRKPKDPIQANPRRMELRTSPVAD